MESLIKVGASQEAIKEAKFAIIEILNSLNNDQATKVKALETLQEICNVNYTTVTNCVLTGTKNEYINNKQIKEEQIIEDEDDFQD